MRYAPDAYRIAIPFVLDWVRRHITSQDAAAAYALLDFLCTFTALLLYCGMLRRSAIASGTRPAQRISRLALFFAFAQIPLAWVEPWQRPETTPTALYVGAALFCLLASRKRLAWLIWLCVLTVWQSFVRSDVPAILGLSILLVGSLSRRGEGVVSRKQLALCGLAILAIAASIQTYLQLVAFPGLTYPPGTDVLQWRENLGRHNLAVFGTVLFPLVLLGTPFGASRVPLDSLDRIVLTASAFYLVLWYMVGNTAEVRLYVPFLFAMCFISARALSAWALDHDQDSDPVSSL